MSFRTRSARRAATHSKRKFLFTIFFLLFLVYATISWILPNTIGGIGLVANSFKEPKKVEKPVSETATLAPPVLSIPFEATNSASITVKGYSTSGAKVNIYHDDEIIETIKVGSDGSFESQPIFLVLGTNNIYAKSMDDKDQESFESKTFKIFYDREKPNVAVTDPKESSISTDQDKITIVGTTDEDAQIYVNNIRQIVDSSGKFQATVPLNSGENNIIIKAVDPASNFREIARIVNFTSPSPTPTP